MDADETMIQSIIDRNLTHTITKFVQANEHPHLVFQGSWCLANLATGNKHQIQSMGDRGLFDVLPMLLNSVHDKIYEQGVWIVGNISADADIFRKKLYSMDILHMLCTKILNSDDYQIIKMTCWALSNLVRGKKIDENKDKEGIVPLCKIIMNYENEEILSDALAGLADLMDNQYLGLIIEAKLPARLYTIAKRGVTDHLYTICQIMSHVSYGTYEQSMIVIQEGFLPILFDILSSTIMSAPFKKEVLWIISNLTVGELDQIQAVLCNIERFNILMTLCKHDNKNVRREAIWSICNVTNNGDAEVLNSLVSNGVLAMFNYNLELDTSSEVCRTIFEALENILNLDETLWDRTQEHPMYDLMNQNGLLEKLEMMLGHQDVKVYNSAIKIIDGYFDIEDEF